MTSAKVNNSKFSQAWPPFVFESRQHKNQHILHPLSQVWVIRRMHVESNILRKWMFDIFFGLKRFYFKDLHAILLNFHVINKVKIKEIENHLLFFSFLSCLNQIVNQNKRIHLTEFLYVNSYFSRIIWFLLRRSVRAAKCPTLNVMRRKVFRRKAWPEISP